jgi:molybdopterin synthase catalytic subunit
MSIHVAIHDGPLNAAEPWAVQGAGAVLCFDGVVRPVEGDRPIAGLRYDTYDPMAEQELTRLADKAVEQFGLLGVTVEHSRGFVANFACSFRLRIASAHRKEALAAMEWFIDRMKQQVPIWKRPVAIEQPTEVSP